MLTIENKKYVFVAVLTVAIFWFLFSKISYYEVLNTLKTANFKIIIFAMAFYILLLRVYSQRLQD